MQSGQDNDASMHARQDSPYNNASLLTLNHVRILSTVISMSQLSGAGCGGEVARALLRTRMSPHHLAIPLLAAGSPSVLPPLCSGSWGPGALPPLPLVLPPLLLPPLLLWCWSHILEIQSGHPRPGRGRRWWQACISCFCFLLFSRSQYPCSISLHGSLDPEAALALWKEALRWWRHIGLHAI